MSAERSIPNTRSSRSWSGSSGYRRATRMPLSTSAASFRASNMMKTRRTAGFSLVEVAIAMAILGIVLAMIYMTLFSSSAEYEANAKRAWIIHQGRVALDEMVEDVRQSNRFSLTPLTPPATMISFKKVKKPLADGTAQYTANWITYRTMKAD